MAKSISGKAFDILLFKRIMSYVSPYKKMFYATVFLVISLALIALVRPLIIQRIVNHNLLTMDKKGLFNLSILLVVVLVVESILQYFFTLFGNLLGQHIIKDLRNDIFKHVLDFKLQYFDKTPIGRLVTRTVSDVETIAEMFSQGVLVIIGDLLKIFTVIVCMLYINWDLALITLIPLPILFFATSIFKKVIKKSFQEVRKQISVLNTFVQEHITGMSIVQIFNREEDELGLF